MPNIDKTRPDLYVPEESPKKDARRTKKNIDDTPQKSSKSKTILSDMMTSGKMSESSKESKLSQKGAAIKPVGGVFQQHMQQAN